MIRTLGLILLSTIATFGQFTVGRHTGATAASGSTPVTKIGSLAASFAGTTLNTTAAAPSGGRIFVGWINATICTDATNGVTGATDQVGNTYTRDIIITTGSSRFFCGFSAHVGTTLPSGNTVSLTCATSNGCGGQMYVFYLTATGSLDSPTVATIYNAFSGTMAITAAAAVAASDTCLTFTSADAISGDTFGAPTNSFAQVFAPLSTSSGTFTYTWKSVASGTPTTGNTLSPSDAWRMGIVCYAN